MGRHEPSSARPRFVATEATFEDMYDAHVRDVYRYVYRRCNDRALAEDITQDTFLAAVDTITDPGSISIGWLLAVAKNKLVDVLRRETRYERKLRLVGARDAESHEVELTERLRVEAALSDISVQYRLVLTLHHIEGMTVPELAKELDRSVRAVESLVARARRQLKARLADGSEVKDRGSNG